MAGSQPYIVMLPLESIVKAVVTTFRGASNSENAAKAMSSGREQNIFSFELMDWRFCRKSARRALGMARDPAEGQTNRSTVAIV